MNAGSFKKRSVGHDSLLLVTHVQRETSAGDLFSDDIECETTEIIMAEEVRVCVDGA